ncbi:hypothetical protein PK98_00240 [Croceibacterium mercuriale]|uniref:Uncharacterized protein n=1 Tax=Croceibacterium mercuriale TaxID=1572751 RepID=A0A0B2BZ20_9SPHN|nr:hypothetical protein [Croceibacterium mercuriale]KHL25237.1 hypothetical protein PK98_00240 [Croceibacterium mercuriale]
MNVQPASLSFRLAPAAVPHDARTVRPEGVLTGWQGPVGQGLPASGRHPPEDPVPLAEGRHAPPEVVAGPALVVGAVQCGDLPQDRSRDGLAAQAPGQMARSSSPGAFSPVSGPFATGHGPAQFHWRSPPPGLLAALQEGGRARIATLFP